MADFRWWLNHYQPLTITNHHVLSTIINHPQAPLAMDTSPGCQDSAPTVISYTGPSRPSPDPAQGLGATYLFAARCAALVGWWFSLGYLGSNPQNQQH